MSDPNLFNQLLIWPIINLLVLFYKGLIWVGIPGSFGWAIIFLTIAVRLILYPLTVSQLKSAKKMAELKPHLDHLAEKHKKDKKRLQKEQLKLFQSSGVNPASGCLPLLLQFPVLIALFRVFSNLLTNGNLESLTSEINKILYFPFLHIDFLELNFFGVNLAVRPNQWQKIGVGLLVIPIITAVLQMIQANLMSPGQQVKDIKGSKKSKVKEKEKVKKEDDMQKAMQTQMKYFMPFFVGYLSLSFPLGLSLYWNTFTLFGIMQQIIVNRSKS